MKFIITENQEIQLINYMNTIFDSMFNVSEIMFGPVNEFDWDTGTNERYDDEWEFYRLIKSQKDLVFGWYDSELPTVQIYGGIGQDLDEEYGNVWKPIFKEWFEDNFGKPVKEIKY